MSAATKIEMRDICVEFPGVKALQDVNFSFESGHVTALVGANGAGKSTLMKVLSGVYNHYTGQIYVDGKEVESEIPISPRIWDLKPSIRRWILRWFPP